MAFVWRVGSYHGTEYFNTAREAGRCKPGCEEPESFSRVDGAAECNRLEIYIENAERTSNRLRLMLRDLLGICPVETVHGTEAGRNALEYLAKNPLPPATAADRDGQRSYGT